jgi:hypothetical protein
MAKAIDKVGDARPYVERALRDEDLRENVKNAFAAARDAYYELFGDQGMRAVAVRAATDEDIQDNLKTAIDELREAAGRLQGKEDHGTRNAILLISGIALAALFNPMTGPQTRKWLSEQLFGGGDEFTYSGSTTSSPSSGNTGG